MNTKIQSSEINAMKNNGVPSSIHSSGAEDRDKKKGQRKKERLAFPKSHKASEGQTLCSHRVSGVVY